MSEQNQSSAEAAADQLASVCTEPILYRRLLGTDNARLVDELLAAARSWNPQLLHVAAERFRDALRDAGCDVGSSRGAIPLAVSSRARTEQVYLCPLRACSRYWLKIEHRGDPVPHCAACGQPLRERTI